MKNNEQRQEVIDKIIDYFNDNEEIFNQCVEELDSWNGYLGDDRYYNMEDLNELYNCSDPLELLQRAFYGHDDETFEINVDGSKDFSRSSFNPNRDYFYYNGYGNLVSADYKDYSDKLDDDLIDELQSARYEVDVIDQDPDLAELFDELDAVDGAFDYKYRG